MLKHFSPKILFWFLFFIFWALPILAQEVDTAWVRIYKGPVDKVDLPSNIIVDVSGNVYVTGASDGGETYYDYTTIKYDVTGNQVFVPVRSLT